MALGEPGAGQAGQRREAWLGMTSVRGYAVGLRASLVKGGQRCVRVGGIVEGEGQAGASSRRQPRTAGVIAIASWRALLLQALPAAGLSATLRSPGLRSCVRASASSVGSSDSSAALRRVPCNST